MKLLLSKESYLHSKDYFELLSTIDTKPKVIKTNNKPFFKTKDGIVVNPNFTSEMYEKLNQNKTFIKCCCIRFEHNNSTLIVNGETHSGSVKNAKDILNIVVSEYERGFLLSNMTFISCEEAPSFIKNYKLNNSFSLKKENYTCEIILDKVIFLKDSAKMIQGEIIKEKRNKHKWLFLININFYLYDNICKTLLLSINLRKNTVKLLELKKIFRFSKRKSATFTIDKIITPV